MRFLFGMSCYAWLAAVVLALPLAATEGEADAWKLWASAPVWGGMLLVGATAYFYADGRFRVVLALGGLTIAASCYFAIWWNSHSTQRARALEHVYIWDDSPRLPSATPRDRAWLPVAHAQERLARARLAVIDARHTYERETRDFEEASPRPWLAWLLYIVPGMFGAFLLIAAWRMTPEEAEDLVAGRS